MPSTDPNAIRLRFREARERVDLSPDQAAKLQEASSSGVNVNKANQFGWTALDAGGPHRKHENRMPLLDRGADVAAVTNSGENVLSVATHRDYLRFVKWLKSWNAELRPSNEAILL